MASVAAASEVAPSRPRNSTSVVLMAIWPSCVSASGSASASVARISAPRDAAGTGAAVATIVDIEGEPEQGIKRPGKLVAIAAAVKAAIHRCPEEPAAAEQAASATPA